ncbi:amino acid permease [Virgibacillus pantothenticus]|uniref:APC family permease n=1 Tax=Virgibacillus TaxID=84406 RepID=UPI0009095655|nr:MULTISPECIES: amino acid permease [Virgibacillus]API92646.1 amino acid permease [Virgibacillus sp. 6R]MBS7428139.1 amino acid permease [Virgibacillus sp. 19R1-5]MBU8565350.1 amino acid permease [Virgibacillus pantothenticus]MBU8599430.1 amino acid permease [Virgibacillus pantothenticus]MBU8633670.1 amino acid permease [Virgibacillus pantothenticus]
MSDSDKLLKVLGNKDVLALAFGAMIGWGWVVTSGLWITEAGSLGAILAFAIGGLLVVFVGLTYAELSSALPLAGGEQVYTFKAMGRVASFIATWAIILGYVSVVAFEAVALPTVFEYIVPNYSQGYLYTIAGWDVTITWAGVGMIGSLLVAWINYRGIKLTSVITVILTTFIIIAGLMLITGSTFGGNMDNMQPLVNAGATGVFTVIIMTPFMFVGFDVIPQAAEEINLPQRKIGQLLILSVVLAVIWYIAIIYGVSRILNPPELSESNLVTADAMAKAFGDSKLMGNVLVLGGIGGILTSWIGFYVGGSRAIYALANAGMLPKFLGKLHPKYKTPHRAIVLIVLLSTAAPLLGRPALVWLVNAGGLGLVVAWLMVAISFILLRKTAPHMNRPFKLPGGTLIGWLAVLMAVGVVILYMPGMPSSLAWPYEWLIIGAWIILGVILYHYSMAKYGKEYASEYMKKELDRIA